MNQEQQRKLAIECGASMLDGKEVRFFHLCELSAYTAAVEAPLQVRIAQLEEALFKLARLGNGEFLGNSIGNTIARDVLVEPSSTWLAEHNKEVTAREREKCKALHNQEGVLAPIGNSSYGECYQDGWIAGTSAYLTAIKELK